MIFQSHVGWLLIGPCNRMLLVSIQCGLDYIYNLCQEDKKTSMYLLSDYEKFNCGGVRYCSCVCCLSPLLSGSVGAMLLEDDRCLLRAAQIYQAVAEEMHYVESLPISFSHSSIFSSAKTSSLNACAMTSCMRPVEHGLLFTRTHSISLGVIR